ncbi:Hsp20/alpha crystallin family protein [Emticicia sp. BO119]|uniref:Hsp20/alpha crystallin family protein n=1 Tax=Emticicia sp. BO119 TaxID=2757768 RepID=UPI0015F010AF|nr:Hsp20/alpha crystallin family protein [Emticicia sp. BO119]MBA4848962.1 Hsp20/alpha crystallin family protein [Emticicia sp. BO119]
MKSTIRKSLPDVTSFFDDNLFFSNFLTKDSFPAVNVKESENAFELEVVAPGIKKDGFKLEIDNEIMTISGEAEDMKEKETKKYYRKEYNFESFSRQFVLPDNLDTDKIEANYTEGVLRINLPKLKEEIKTAKKTISIE